MLIIWDELADSNNPEAVAHTCANIDKFDDFPSNLSANPHAIEWLENNPYYIDWDCILYNSAAESLLRKHGILDKLPRAWQFDADMTRLCSNPAPWALKIVEANIEHVRQYHRLSANPSALPLLLKYSGQKNKYGESIDHAGYLSRNSNPLAIKLITCMPVEIDWKDFSENPAGYEYLNEHREQIDMKTIARNPKIFEPQWPWRVYEDWCSWENACACNVMD